MALATVGVLPATTVLVLGDSLAAGYGIDRQEAFPALLEAKAKAAGHPAEVINAGVSGDTSAGGLRRLNWLLNRKIDILILELGANDGLRGIPPATTLANLQAIIDAARAKFPDLKIIVAGMKMPVSMGAEYAKNYERTFSKVAVDNDAVLVPFLLEGVGGVASLNLDDRVHPNAKGHQILADNVWPTLEPLLKATTQPKSPAP